MLKNLFILALLPVLLYVGAKSLLHYRLGQTVDATIEKMSGVAQVEYDDIMSSVDGKLGISGFSIRPVGMNDQVKVGEIFVQFPGFMYLWNLENHITNQEIPKQLSLVIEGLEFSTTGTIMAKTDEAALENDDELAVMANCPARIGKVPSAVGEIGYGQLIMDMSIGYVMESETSEFRIFGTQTHIDARQMDYEVVFPLDTMDAAGVMRTFSDPTLLRAEITLQEQGFYKRLYEYCQETENLQPQQITEQLVTDLIAQTSVYGIMPDERILNDYRRFLTEGQEIRITSKPFNPQKFSYMPLYKPEDMPDLLNIVTQVN